jgi:Mg-chelatase subunit ChlD
MQNTDQQDRKPRIVLTFDKAKFRHKTCEAAALEFGKRGEIDEGSLVWEALVTADDIPLDTFAEAVRMTMPIDAIPIVRATSGVSASFAFECMAAHYQTTGDFYAMAKAGWLEFEARRKVANTLQEGYGCDASASWELARDISQVRDKARVEEIARMAGRMYKAMSGARKAPTDEPHEVVGVRVGGEVERLVASEITQLFDPDMSDAAAIRILEQQSQQYKMRGKTAVSRGPLVILLDESASMHDDGMGDRNSWAKACALALTRVAHEGNRMVSVVHFSSATAITALPPGDHRAILHMTRHFLSGGTDIAKALAVGFAQVGDLAANGHIGADIVLVTDGEDRNYKSMDYTLGMAQAQGVRLWTVGIECQIDPESPIVKRASDVIRVGGTDRADVVAGLQRAAMNTVSEEDRKAHEARQKSLLN